MKRWLVGAAVLGVLFMGVLAVNAARLASRQPPAGDMPMMSVVSVAPDSAASRLARAIQFQTVTATDVASSGPDAFAAFHAFLGGAFPLIGKNLQVEGIGGGALLYTWPGTRPELAPLILAAHQDVVPVGDAPWTHPPFAGDIADGAVWGRGTLDDKGSLMGILEAAEALLAQGFQPERTIYLAFGHNEESDSPANGAAAIASLLRSRGVHGATVLDEDGWIYDKVPGVRPHVAVIGIAEKTSLSLELRVTSAGGHSSMPPPMTAAGILAHAVDAVERHPLPARLDGAAAALFDFLAPEMSWPMRVLFANRWITQPLILHVLAGQPATNATIRTTTAATMLRAGTKENVLPTDARAVVNFRLLPGDTAASVIAHVTRVVDDPRVQVAVYRSGGGADGDTGSGEASPVSDPGAPAFAALGRAIRSTFPDVLVAPYLALGASDARHYQAIAPDIYRFVPIDQAGATELLHAPNEHIEIRAYADAIRCYGAIIQALSRNR